MNVTLRQLEHALALERHGSFHRAARAEHISQPAFSRSIRNLELALGAQLFDRSGSRIRATVFGEALLRRAVEIVGQTRELGRELGLLQGLEIGRLRVAVGTFLAEMSAVKALGELVRRYPRVRCTAKVTNWRQVGELVLRGAADLGVADIGGLLNHQQLEVERISRQELLFFCRPGHPLLERQSLTVGDLESYPLAFTRLPSHLEDYRPFERIMEEETGDLLPHIEVDDFPIAKTVVAASDALGAAPPVQIEAAVRGGELCVLPFRAPWLALDCGFIRLRGSMAAPSAVRYMQIVRELDAEITARNRALADALLAERATGNANGARRIDGDPQSPA